MILNIEQLTLQCTKATKKLYSINYFSVLHSILLIFFLPLTCDDIVKNMPANTKENNLFSCPETL